MTNQTEQRGIHFFESSVLNEKRIRKSLSLENNQSEQNVMTINGAITKALFLSTILLVFASYNFIINDETLLITGVVVGFILGLVCIFRMRLSPYLAPFYAAMQGLALGGITAEYTVISDGIVFEALTITIGILFLMLFVYKTKIIPITNRLQIMVTCATGAVLITYVLQYVLQSFEMNIPFMHESGVWGIIFSCIVLVIASFHLLLDFDQIQKCHDMKAPKYMEWYCAFSLLITVIWIYLEVLRLLGSGDDE